MKATQKIVSLNAITIDGIERPAQYKESGLAVLVSYDGFVLALSRYDDAFVPARLAAQHAAAAERGDSEQMKRLSDALEYYYNGDGKTEPEKPGPFAFFFTAFDDYFTAIRRIEEAKRPAMRPEPRKPRKPGPLSVPCSILSSALSAFFSYKRYSEGEAEQPAEAVKAEAQQPAESAQPAEAAKVETEQPAAQTDEPEQPLDLRREVVAFTGRLSAMTRDEAIKAVRKCGGKAYEDLTTACTVLVVGARPGRRKLDKAARWHGLRQISEAAFLAALKAAKQPDAKRPVAKAEQPAAARPIVLRPVSTEAMQSAESRIIYAPSAIFVDGKQYPAKYSELGSFVHISYDGKKVSIGPDHPDYVPAGLAASAALFEELGEPDQVRRFTDSLASHYAGDRQERAAA